MQDLVFRKIKHVIAQAKHDVPMVVGGLRVGQGEDQLRLDGWVALLMSYIT